MNFNKFINSDYLKENPLCGIDTYKDELNLTNGACTRRIKKLVLTGEEYYVKDGNAEYLYYEYITHMYHTDCFCSHLASTEGYPTFKEGCSSYNNASIIYLNFGADIMNTQPSGNTVAGLKEYLATQYAAGTPVTVWYVPATPTTETITVPSGLSGTVEGYLNQSGTPTPTNPIYPTANTVEQWFNLNHYIMGTSTDTITTLPADIYPAGTTATVGLKGQTTQSSIPSPTSPVMPQGTGDRTGNLVRFYQEEMQGSFYGVDITVKNAEITLNGTVTKGSGHWVEIGYKLGGGTESTDNVVIPCEPEAPYTIATEILDGNLTQVRVIAFGTSNENRTVNIGSSSTTTFSGDINRIFISLGAEGVVFNNLKFRVMFNKGSAQLPYEPYGVKIPISSASTTTPVYLGEVETTRKIGKLVLTGKEGWTVTSNGVFRIGLSGQLRPFTPLCTHYLGSDATAWSNVPDKSVTVSISGYLAILDTTYTTITDFKSYLAQQYANGTPVTVWYVLATSTTGIVNEPLMKIGDYADTVSGISIPTIAGANTLSVDTTLQPSEVTVNYKGWHPIQNVHEAENGQWD